MPLPRVVSVLPGSPGALAGVAPGDEIAAVDGRAPRDIIEYQLLADSEEVTLELRRGGLEQPVTLRRQGGEPLGLEVDAALFDQVRTCDNHCEFCFIHQLPKGLRRSLYVRDDDYRLSWLYGNFTTLTRFTEADLERVVLEGLSPLWVSIHSTNPELRARILRNPRGATSLRWLRALLDHGVTVHGQVVVCPGVNDGAALEDTLAGVLDLYPELESVACVPLGVSQFNTEAAMRPHTPAEAATVVDLVERWQLTFLDALGRRIVYASDELYLMSGRSFPALDTYGELAQHDNGVGMARAFEAGFCGRPREGSGPSGFFASVDGAPATGYRAPRTNALSTTVSPSNPIASGVVLKKRHPKGSATLSPHASAPITVLTGSYGAEVLRPLVAAVRPDAEVRVVPNLFFGGNIGVAGLLTGADLAPVLEEVDPGRRCLLGDSCLSGGRFLDGTSLDDLPRRVEVVRADGASLRAALGG